MAPRASFMSPETGSEVEPSTTCTVTGIDRIPPRLGAPAIGSGFASSAAVGASEVAVWGAAARWEGVWALRLGCFVSLCDRALDFETVASVRLAELAGEHSAAGTFEANGAKIVALQGQKPANLEVGDVA